MQKERFQGARITGVCLVEGLLQGLIHREREMIESHTIQIGDATLVFHLHGTGDTVVLLPTAGCSTSYFVPLMRTLAEAGFQTVAINWRGVGGSVGPLEEATLHDLATDVAGVIKSLEVSPVHVLGHAFGNRVARCLSTDCPDLVRSVILLVAGGLAEPAPANRVLLHEQLRSDMTADQRVQVMGARWLSPASDPRLLLSVECTPTMHTAHLATSGRTPLDDWWTAGEAPLLVIQGLDDRGAPPSNGYVLRGQLGTRVQVVDIPQAAHFLVLEQPEAVSQAVIAFLQEQTQDSFSVDD